MATPPTPWKLPNRLPPAPDNGAWVVRGHSLRRLRLWYWALLVAALAVAWAYTALR